MWLNSVTAILRETVYGRVVVFLVVRERQAKKPRADCFPPIVVSPDRALSRDALLMPFGKESLFAGYQMLK